MNHEFQCRKTIVPFWPILQLFMFLMYKLSITCLSLARTMERNLSFCGSTYIVPFLCISLMYLFTEFSTFIMFLISCHSLFLHPEVIDEENFAFKIAVLFSYSSNNTTFSLSVQFGFRLDIFYFRVTNSNIQTHSTLNVYPHKVIKACIIYLLKN